MYQEEICFQKKQHNNVTKGYVFKNSRQHFALYESHDNLMSKFDVNKQKISTLYFHSVERCDQH